LIDTVASFLWATIAQLGLTVDDVLPVDQILSALEKDRDILPDFIAMQALQMWTPEEVDVTQLSEIKLDKTLIVRTLLQIVMKQCYTVNFPT